MLRDIVVSSRKDKANLKWRSEREETFYLREISEKAQKSLKESVQQLSRVLLRERSDYGQRCPRLSKVSQELFEN